MGSVVAETYRLALRPVTAADAAATAALMTPEVAARLLCWPAPMTVGQARARIDQGIAGLAAGTGADLAIVRHSDGRLIGWFGGSVIDPVRRLGSIGYWIGAAFQDQGYMSEAAHAALPWLVDRLGLLAVEACVQEHNFGSQAVLEGLGFQLKAHRRMFSPTRGAEEKAIAFAVPAGRLTLRPSFAPERRAYAMR